MRARLERLVLQAWYDPQPGPAAQWLIRCTRPLAALTGWLARRRRKRIEQHLIAPPRPLIVVGNLIAGGAGKTPAVIAIARALAARGWKPSIVCRSYRARRSEPSLVDADSDAAEVGDEAVVIAQATGLPVASARRRTDALELIRAAHPETDVLLADDGLQHEALPRTVEIVVFDRRGVGNGLMLPAGPLREPLVHAARMDVLLLNGKAEPPLAHPRIHHLHVEPGLIHPLTGESGVGLTPTEFARRVRGRELIAFAGIADPSRFFETVAAIGLRATPHAAGDHARVGPDTLAALQAPFILMTEKDAVKFRTFADERCFALRVDTRVDDALIDWLEERLRGQPFA